MLNTCEAIWNCVDHHWTCDHRPGDVIYHYFTNHGYHQIRHSSVWFESKLKSYSGRAVFK